MRAFVTLDLPEALIAPLARLQAGLDVGRAVPEDNLHLTLAFLGEVNAAALSDLALGLEGLSLAPVELSLRGLDLFGGRKPGVLFAAVEATPDLTHLHAKVLQAVRAAGIDMGRERFRPHVTIARLPRVLGPKDERRLADFLHLNGAFSTPPATATSVTLYESHLRPEGPLHLPLASVDLRSQATP